MQFRTSRPRRMSWRLRLERVSKVSLILILLLLLLLFGGGAFYLTNNLVLVVIVVLVVLALGGYGGRSRLR